MRNDTVTHARLRRNRLRKLNWLPLFAAALLSALQAPAAAQTVDMAAVEKALMDEDWKQLTNQLLKAVNDNPEQSPNPVLRLLKGHACLAVNENNEAVCLFLSVQTPEDRELWLQWANQFATRCPHSPIAQYFKGDALARLDRLDDALDCFTLAIEQAPGKQHALAFNARGVIHASGNDFRKARADFDSAVVSSGGRLAEAYASIGALRIDSKEAANAALRAFNRVVGDDTLSPPREGLSPQYALALHGRACVEVVLDKFERAKKDFLLAEQYGRRATPLLERNRLRIVFHLANMTEEDLVAIRSGADTGTTIDSRIEANSSFSSAIANWRKYHARPTETNYNKFHNSWSKLTQGQQDRVWIEVGNAMRTSAGIKASTLGHATRTMVHNRRDGAGDKAADLLHLGTAFATTLGTATDQRWAGGAGPSGGYFSNKIRETSRRNEGGAVSFLQRCQNAGFTGRKPVGGLDMNLTNVVWDSGDWPFCGYYGLMYDNTDVDEPHETTAATK